MSEAVLTYVQAKVYDYVTERTLLTRVCNENSSVLSCFVETNIWHVTLRCVNKMSRLEITFLCRNFNVHPA